jgi:hypothetical protein
MHSLFWIDLFIIIIIIIIIIEVGQDSPMLLCPQMGLLYKLLMIDEYGASVEW